MVQNSCTSPGLLNPVANDEQLAQERSGPSAGIGRYPHLVIVRERERMKERKKERKSELESTMSHPKSLDSCIWAGRCCSFLVAARLLAAWMALVRQKREGDDPSNHISTASSSGHHPTRMGSLNGHSSEGPGVFACPTTQAFGVLEVFFFRTEERKKNRKTTELHTTYHNVLYILYINHRISSCSMHIINPFVNGCPLSFAESADAHWDLLGCWARGCP